MTIKDAVKALQETLNAHGAKLTLDGELGPYTISAYTKLSLVVVPIPLPPSKPGDEPSYITLAKSYVGEHEVSGSKDNNFIVQLFTATSYWSTIKKMLSRRDEVAWCAAFRDWILRKASYEDANSAAAKDGRKIGRDVTKNPVPFAVAVWKHLKGSLKNHYHTNFLLEPIYKAGKLVGWWCIGGNQSNAVTIAAYYYADHELYYAGVPEKVA